MADKPLKAHQFQPGNPGGPGRPKGSRNKLAESFVAALSADFDQHGEDAIKRTRENDPSTYVRVVASLLPKELEIKRPLEEMSDDDLAAAIELLRLQLATAAANAGGGSPSARSGKPH